MATQFATSDISARGQEATVEETPMDLGQQAEDQVDEVEQPKEPEPVKPASRFGCASE